MKNKTIWIVGLYFMVYLLAGMHMIPDYGLSTDESIQRTWGNEYYDLIMKKDPLGNFEQGQYYGPFFQILLAFQEHLFNWQDTSAVFLSYHAMTFLFFFIGVVFLYLLVQKIFGKWKLSLLACSILILSPRIFADSFYNPKDIPFLVVNIISMYTLLWLIKKPNYLTAGMHGIASAAAISTRIIGIMVPALSIIALLLMVLLRKHGRSFKFLGIGLFYLLLTSAFTVLFWPILYFKPEIFIETFNYMRNFPFPSEILYEGQLYRCTALYRNYLPHWIAITTPIPYLITFMIGVLVISIRQIWNIRNLKWINEHLHELLFLMWALLPVLYVVALRPCIYNGWRHFYFVYPALVLIGIIGIHYLYEKLGKLRWPDRMKRWGNCVLSFFLIGSLAWNACLMYLDHPNEFLYFNRLAGKDMNEILTRYEGDYWHISSKQAFEYILTHDPSARINILNRNQYLQIYTEILPIQDRNRLFFVNTESEADYAIVFGPDTPSHFPSATLFYSIEIHNGHILSVYRF